MAPRLRTWLDYIERVLDDAKGEPLHESEITSRAIALGYPTSGQTPSRTVNRVLNEHPDLFESLGYGRYRKAGKGASHLSFPAAPEVQDALQSIEERAGRPSAGQSMQISAALRREVERYAMIRATAHYQVLGWDVEDVSSSQPFDLRCTRPNGEELRVEVKGTTGDGSRILLTPNEVEHARSNFPRIALFVVSAIEASDESEGKLGVTGGQNSLFQPWDIDAGVLKPIGYAYTLGDG